MSTKNNLALVPASMLLGKDVIELIAGHCGDGNQMFGDYTDGLLWVGDLEGDDGEKTHGLHIMTEEYPEEGSSTLVEFPRTDLPAYDEAKERELFEEWYGGERIPSMDGNNRFMHDQDGVYWFVGTRKAWTGWQACAKSRARSAE